MFKISDFRQNWAYLFWSSKLTKIWFQMNFLGFSLTCRHESIQNKCDDWNIYFGYILSGTPVEQLCQNDLIFVIFSLKAVLKLAKKFFLQKFSCYHYKIHPRTDICPKCCPLIWKIQKVITFLRISSNFGQISGQYLVWSVK